MALKNEVQNVKEKLRLKALKEAGFDEQNPPHQAKGIWTSGMPRVIIAYCIIFFTPFNPFADILALLFLLPLKVIEYSDKLLPLAWVMNFCVGLGLLFLCRRLGWRRYWTIALVSSLIPVAALLIQSGLPVGGLFLIATFGGGFLLLPFLVLYFLFKFTILWLFAIWKNTGLVHAPATE